MKYTLRMRRMTISPVIQLEALWRSKSHDARKVVTITGYSQFQERMEPHDGRMLVNEGIFRHQNDSKSFCAWNNYVNEENEQIVSRRLIGIHDLNSLCTYQITYVSSSICSWWNKKTSTKQLSFNVVISLQIHIFSTATSKSP